MELLKVEHLSKVYGKGENEVKALDDVSFLVQQGEFVAIIGPSGSGKSTLLHILGGVDRPTSGHVYLDGKDIYSQNEEQLAHTRKLFATLREAGKCQTFLVLSATTKYRDLLKIVASYEGIDDFQLIFTKLDETAAMGNLLNLRLFTGTAIAFVTNGQNVPNDIEQFNPQKTVKQILSTRQEQTL